MSAEQLRRSLELLWGTKERPARGPKPGLTLDRIVDAAIEVADAQGLEGLSMRAVAAELGVGTMSLYRYVPGKTELLELMTDRLSAPGKQADRARDLPWREALAEIARDTRALYLAHPWLIKINWTRPVLGPNTLAGVDLYLALLGDLGLTDQERVMVMVAVDAYVVGMTRNDLLYASAAEETGVSDEEFWRLQIPALEQAMATGDYPTLANLSEDAFNAGWDENFELGLKCLLDGLARLVESRQPAPPPAQ